MRGGAAAFGIMRLDKVSAIGRRRQAVCRLDGAFAAIGGFYERREKMGARAGEVKLMRNVEAKLV